MEENSLSWYPLRVFFGRAGMIIKTLEDAGIEHFYPTTLTEMFSSGELVVKEEPVIRSLVFVRTSSDSLHRLQSRYHGSMIPYIDHSTHTPLKVPDDQMDTFMRICKIKSSGLEYLGDDNPKYHQGDRVRVIEGVFKGFEGHIKRIRHDRRLIVTIEGVAVFATRFIPPSFLEKIES